MTQYLVKKAWARVLLKGIDTCLPQGKQHGPIQTPKKILLCNGAHLGDVVIATSVLPVLKDAFPKAEIGFLVGSWSKEVVEDHPLVDHLHIVDHWKISRARLPLWKKLKVYFQSRKKAITDIKQIGYDVAIDLYYYFGNAIALLRASSIPIRIGYTSAGFGPLLTHPCDRVDAQQYVPHYYRELLSLLPLKEESMNRLKVTLECGDLSPLFSAATSRGSKSIDKSMPNKAATSRRTPKSLRLKDKPIILHVGASAPIKLWDEEKWRALAARFSEEGYAIIFTGKGSEENGRIERIRQGIKNSVSFCDLLSWQELLATINSAKLVITIDSVTQHIAAAFARPAVAIFSGDNSIEEWKPDSPTCKALLKSASWEEVYEEAKRLL